MLILKNYTLAETGSESMLYQLDVSNLNINEIISINLVDGVLELSTTTSKSLKDMYTSLNTSEEFAYNLTNDILHLQMPIGVDTDNANFMIEYNRYPNQIVSEEDTIDIAEEDLGILTDYIIAESAKMQGKLIPEQVANNIMEYENDNT